MTHLSLFRMKAMLDLVLMTHLSLFRMKAMLDLVLMTHLSLNDALKFIPYKGNARLFNLCT